MSLSNFNMFRIIAIVLLSSLLLQTAFAQTDSATVKKFRHGISVGTFISGVPGYPYYTVSYSIAKGRNRFSIGPVLGEKGGGYEGPRYYYQIHLKNESIFKGLTGVYQFFPNPLGKRYDLFFQYEATWFYFKYDGMNTQTLIETTLPNYASCWYFGQYFGYGLRVRFLKNFEITHNIGLGYLVGGFKESGMKSRSAGHGLSGNTRLSLSYTFR